MPRRCLDLSCPALLEPWVRHRDHGCSLAVAVLLNFEAAVRLLTAHRILSSYRIRASIEGMSGTTLDTARMINIVSLLCRTHTSSSPVFWCHCINSHIRCGAVPALALGCMAGSNIFSFGTRGTADTAHAIRILESSPFVTFSPDE